MSSSRNLNLPFALYDVFAERPFGGNPLAVFEPHPALTPAVMQAIAREFNHSETAFLEPSNIADFRIRIFTPDRELPMAGHPVVGACRHVAGRDGVAKNHVYSVELGIGTVAVRIVCGDGTIDEVSMDQAPPHFRELNAGPGETLRAVSLAPSSPVAAPPEIVSTGVPFLMLRLSVQEDVDAAKPKFPELDALLESTGAVGVFTFALLETGPPARLYSRMFCHLGSVTEDAATGSASGCAAAWLAARASVPADADGIYRFLSTQGVKMGRPSLVKMEAEVNQARVASIRVAGRAIPMMSGTFHLDGSHFPLA